MRKISEGIRIFMGGGLFLLLLSFSLKPQRAGAAASFPAPHLGIAPSFPAGIPSQRSSRVPSPGTVSSCGSSQFHGGTQGIDSHPWMDVCYHPWQESQESLEFHELIISIKRAVKQFSVGFFFCTSNGIVFPFHLTAAPLHQDLPGSAIPGIIQGHPSESWL